MDTREDLCGLIAMCTLSRVYTTDIPPIQLGDCRVDTREDLCGLIAMCTLSRVYTTDIPPIQLGDCRVDTRSLGRIYVVLSRCVH